MTALALATLALAVLGVRTTATPNEARIPLDAVAAVHVKERDSSWMSYIAGAPPLVNRDFMSRYGPPVTPTPEPPAVDGFTVSGVGPETHTFEASGILSCSVDYERPRSAAGISVDVRIAGDSGTPWRTGPSGTTSPVSQLSSTQHREIYFGDRYPDLEGRFLSGGDRFLPPYSVVVLTAEYSVFARGIYVWRPLPWTVECRP